MAGVALSPLASPMWPATVTAAPASVTSLAPAGTVRSPPTATSPPCTSSCWAPPSYDPRTQNTQVREKAPQVAVDVAEAAGGLEPKIPENTLGTCLAGSVTRTRFVAKSKLTQLPGDAATPAGRGWGSTRLRPWSSVTAKSSAAKPWAAATAAAVPAVSAWDMAAARAAASAPPGTAARAAGETQVDDDGHQRHDHGDDDERDEDRDGSAVVRAAFPGGGGSAQHHDQPPAFPTSARTASGTGVPDRPDGHLDAGSMAARRHGHERQDGRVMGHGADPEPVALSPDVDGARLLLTISAFV